MENLNWDSKGIILFATKMNKISGECVIKISSQMILNYIDICWGRSATGLHVVALLLFFFFFSFFTLYIIRLFWKGFETESSNTRDTRNDCGLKYGVELTN